MIVGPDEYTLIVFKCLTADLGSRYSVRLDRVHKPNYWVDVYVGCDLVCWLRVTDGIIQIILSANNLLLGELVRHIDLADPSCFIQLQQLIKSYYG